MILAISESPLCWKHSIKFLLKRIYCLEEYIVWKKILDVDFLNGCLVHGHL